jgi:hypothetical protein
MGRARGYEVELVLAEVLPEPGEKPGMSTSAEPFISLINTERGWRQTGLTSRAHDTFVIEPDLYFVGRQGTLDSMEPVAGITNDR